jgi:hypothetical protein
LLSDCEAPVLALSSVFVSSEEALFEASSSFVSEALFDGSVCSCDPVPVTADDSLPDPVLSVPESLDDPVSGSDEGVAVPDCVPLFVSVLTVSVEAADPDSDEPEGVCSDEPEPASDDPVVASG